MRNGTCLKNAMFFIIVVIVIVNICFGQSYWKRTYYEGYAETWILTNKPTILQTQDDGFIYGENIISSGASEISIKLRKIKANGDTLWTRTFPGEMGQDQSTIIPTPDGNFLVAGLTTVGSYFLMKINSNGDVLWTKTYGEITGTSLYIILPTSDDNFLLGGLGYRDISIVKVTPNGDFLWTRTFKCTPDLSGFTILPITQGYLLSFLKNKDCKGSALNYLLKISQNGDSIWTKIFEETGDFHTFFNIILPTIDGNYLLGGHRVGIDSRSVLLAIITPNGETLWTGTYNQDVDEICAVLPIPDGNFIIAGCYTKYYPPNAWLTKIQPNGDNLWTKVYKGGIEYVSFSKILPTSDGNYLLAGKNYLSNEPGWGICLVKINHNGDTLWTRSIIPPADVYQPTIYSTQDDNFILAGFDVNMKKSVLIFIVADQYASNASLFTYKIPTYCDDTLNFGYVPLKTPSGMIVSTGGTISWTPQTDSAYMEHVEFLVVNDAGGKDTLTFNIFINSNYKAQIKSIKQSNFIKNACNSFEILTAPSSHRITFSLPAATTSLHIYDINGRLIDRVVPIISNSRAYAVWPGNSPGCAKIPTGKYFAKVTMGKNGAVKPFLYIR